MVESIIIGIGTVVALSWLLTISMANESDAEKRRCAMPGAKMMAGEEDAAWSITKRAA